MITILAKKLSESAKVPTKGSSKAAAYDLYSSEERVVIPAGTRRGISTDIALVIPDGYYGQIQSRSGLAFKAGVDTLGGVIDSDYRGEIKVAVLNTGVDTLEFNHGERIAQLVILPIPESQMLETKGPLTATVRGQNGFGSTGA